MKISEAVREIETFAPLHLQESYDNSGYICGNPEELITGILLAIDITEQVIDEAIEKNCNLIISHHPLIFKGIKKLIPTNYINRCLIKAIKNNITIYAAHTNIDSVSNGVSMTMAEKLNLQNTTVLCPKDEQGDGLGLIGELPQSVPALELLQTIKQQFKCQAIRHSSICKKEIKTVAVCGGSGAEFIELAINANADIYITGDIKHHDWFRAEDKIIIADIGHYESEQYTKELFYSILTKKITNFAVHYSQTDKSPVSVL